MRLYLQYKFPIMMNKLNSFKMTEIKVDYAVTTLYFKNKRSSTFLIKPFFVLFLDKFFLRQWFRWYM